MKTIFDEIEGLEELNEEQMERVRDFCKEMNEVVIPQLLEAREIPRWEAVMDEDTKESDDQFWRVRWSRPNHKNEYLYAAHYGGNGSSMNRAMAESTANNWNKIKKLPL